MRVETLGEELSPQLIRKFEQPVRMVASGGKTILCFSNNKDKYSTTLCCAFSKEDNGKNTKSRETH